MNLRNPRERLTFEIMLIVVAIGMTYLMYRMGGYKMVALNLFYLPIVLSGYFLGRTSAGILALFCALSVTVATSLDPRGFAAFSSPIMMGLALAVWASVLGLTAILVGTLCDERAQKVEELHEAYVGVVEVLTRYLQSGNPKFKNRSLRVSELCQNVAEELRLSRKQIDDIRVGALLHDLRKVEITTKLINRVVGSLENQSSRADRHTFLGADLVHSLGEVLHGAVPLLLAQESAGHLTTTDEETSHKTHELPIGARIIRTVGAYDELTMSESAPRMSPQQALRELRRDPDVDAEVLAALARVVQRQTAPAVPKPAFV